VSEDRYPWYETVRGDRLEQGDILRDFTVLVGTRRRSNRLSGLRLCPPYREHLAQAFARFFMRVGLPIPIPPAKLKGKQ
jgi:hypothetical protein